MYLCKYDYFRFGMHEIQNIENALTSSEYTTLLRDIITDIKSMRVVVAHKINSSMMQLYWNIGKPMACLHSHSVRNESLGKKSPYAKPAFHRNASNH